MEARSDEHVLRWERVLPAPPPSVFTAFTDPNKLRRWWGPEGFTVASLRFHAQVGEDYRIEMQPPEGDAFYLTGEFREVDAPIRLAYTFVWEPLILTMSRRSRAVVRRPRRLDGGRLYPRTV